MTSKMEERTKVWELKQTDKIFTALMMMIYTCQAVLQLYDIDMGSYLSTVLRENIINFTY